MQYACNKFGSACRVALAIQRAENPKGACEIYHYNSDGTLDWGYFQINTVHLTRVGLNLRDLLDCRANIDFAYQLYEQTPDLAALWCSAGIDRVHLRRMSFGAGVVMWGGKGGGGAAREGPVGIREPPG